MKASCGFGQIFLKILNACVGAYLRIAIKIPDHTIVRKQTGIAD